MISVLPVLLVYEETKSPDGEGKREMENELPVRDEPWITLSTESWRHHSGETDLVRKFIGMALLVVTPRDVSLLGIILERRCNEQMARVIAVQLQRELRWQQRSFQKFQATLSDVTPH